MSSSQWKPDAASGERPVFSTMKSEPARTGHLEHGGRGIYGVERCYQATISEDTAD
jgi:hypothetical protein